MCSAALYIEGLNALLFLRNQDLLNMKKLFASILIILSATALLANGNSKRNSSLNIVRYSFSIDLNDTTDNIEGKTVILLELKERTDSLRFDLRNLRADGRGMSVNSITINDAPASWTHKNNKIAAVSGIPLNVGAKLTVTISYYGVPADGLLISKNRFGNRSFFADHWPDRASNYLPCIDHPADKAAVEFIITAPVHYKVVSNGLLIEESNLAGNRKLTHWREDNPIPVKVMTFGAAEFATAYAGEASGIPVWTYVYPENRAEGISDYSIALKPMEYFASLIGPYPFPKLANVQSKTVFGGLENAGCIFYSEGSVTGTGRSEGLIAHEIAHQWFGNTVTEADWHHVWLSEGFATYLTTLYWEKQQGAGRLQSDMRSARDRVLRASVQNPKPVVDTTIIDLMRLLSANSYQKGAWVLHMLRGEVGEEQFVAGLQLFYSRFRYSNALTSDFQRVMEEVSGRDLEKFFHQWLYVAGEPVLKTEYTYNARNSQLVITVTQTQEHIFSFPLEIEIKGDNGNTKQVRLDVAEKVSRIEVSSTFKPIQIITDPQVKLLFRDTR
jgi:aminopeptidase N